MRSRPFLLALSAVLAVVIGFLVYRQVAQPKVTTADVLTGADTDVIQRDLNSPSVQWQVLIDFRNPYVANVTRLGSDQPVMLCSTKTYFEAAVNHRDVTALTPLTIPGGRALDCWTSRTPPPASG